VVCRTPRSQRMEVLTDETDGFCKTNTNELYLFKRTQNSCESTVGKIQSRGKIEISVMANIFGKYSGGSSSWKQNWFALFSFPSSQKLMDGHRGAGDSGSGMVSLTLNWWTNSG
jgi:hypothetical protein